MDNLSTTSSNGACRALPRESSDGHSGDTAGWQVAVAAAQAGTGRYTAPGPIEPAKLPSGPLSADDYEKVGARNKYLAEKYDPNSWADLAFNLFTGAMTDPANVLTAGERNEHRALSEKIVETLIPQPGAEAARLDAMVGSPIGAIAWLAAHEAGASQDEQDLALGLGRSIEGIAIAYAGSRAGLTFLNAQTELVPDEVPIAADAAKARNGAKGATGAKADEIKTSVDSPGRREVGKVLPTPGRRQEGGGSSTPVAGSGPTAGNAPGVIWLDTPDRILVLESIPIRRGWLNWLLFDGESGAKFGTVDVAIHDRANPGPPSVYLNPKVAELGEGMVTLRAGFSFTAESLRRVQLKWEEEFERRLEEFGGSVLDENLSNFQVEFDRIRAANPGLTPQQIGDLAIREVSFGKARIQIGFGDLSVRIDSYSYGETVIKNGLYRGQRVADVPTVVRVSARRTPGSGGKP